jgi:BirA family biotin operon repressor/biotin-[acetyl-CoA-carboxylase] ligase
VGDLGCGERCESDTIKSGKVMVEEGVIFLNEVDSTNSYLRQLMENADDPQECTMVCAGFQTSGHGQVDNVWESERNANLTFSMLFYPNSILPSEQFYLSQMVSLGVVDFLSSYCKLEDLSIKWPNDVYWKDKKIAGILIENFISGHSIENTIAGVGININQQRFLGDAPNPVSVWQITGQTYDVNAAALAIRQNICARYLQLLKAEKGLLRKDYFERLYRRNGYHKYSDENGAFMAKIEDVKESGILLLTTDAGNRREYAFKEVEYKMEE